MPSVEQWRSVPGFPNYEVSNLGRVRSLYWTKLRDPFITGGKVRYLKLACNRRDGYIRITLFNQGYKKEFGLHQVVALTFLGPTPVGMEIRHKDGKQQNCRLDNLEFGTHKENMHDCFRHGTTNLGKRRPSKSC